MVPRPRECERRSDALGNGAGRGVPVGRIVLEVQPAEWSGN